VNLEELSMRDGVLVDVDFSYANLRGARMDAVLCENVQFDHADISNATFSGSWLMDVSLRGTEMSGADFSNIRPDQISVLIESDEGELRKLEGQGALGYLRYNGCKTDDVPILEVARHHPNYVIVEKILRRLSEQDIRQRRGLVQRGAARQDTDFAEGFVGFLERRGYVEARSRRDLISLTDAGRDLVGSVLERGQVDREFSEFLRDHLALSRITAET
jgi:hypothetical protein